MNAWRRRSRSRSSAGGPSSAAEPARRAYSLPASPGPPCPTRTTALPSARNAGPTRVETSSSSPTMPISGVGAMDPDGDSLYRDTLPPVTGSPRATHASARPRTASASCQKASGRVGSPKLRQFVTPSGRAPVIDTLRAASATDIAAPSHGSSSPTGRCIGGGHEGLVVPLIRITAAPRPGRPRCSPGRGCRTARTPRGARTVGRAEQREQDRARVHAPPGQRVARLVGRTGGGGRPPAGRRARLALEHDRLGCERPAGLGQARGPPPRAVRRRRARPRRRAR